MKKLIIVRHAKSSWDNPGIDDHQRRLNARGKRDAPVMGQRLRERAVIPDLVVASTALRAMDTACLLANALGYDEAEIEPEARLYAATASIWLDLIAALPLGSDTVLLVGHNPEVTELVNRLAPVQVGNVPTCGVLEASFNTARWNEVRQLEPEYWYFDYPKRVAS